MADRNATGKIKIEFQGTITNTLENAAVVSHTLGSTQVVNNLFRTSGVSAEQINRGWASEGRALSSGASETIDIYDFAGVDIGAGAGNDALGQALTLEEIVGILIVQTAGPGRLEFIPAVSNGWTPLGSHTVALGNALKEGAWWGQGMNDTDAFDVADASSHRITFTANGGAVEYSVYILGRHDDDESSSSSLSSSSSSSSASSSSSSTSSSRSSSSSSTSSSVSSVSSSSSSSTSSVSSSSTSSVSSSSTSSLSSSSSSSP